MGWEYLIVNSEMVSQFNTSKMFINFDMLTMIDIAFLIWFDHCSMMALRFNSPVVLGLGQIKKTELSYSAFTDQLWYR